MGIFTGGIVKFVADNVEPAINEIVKKLDEINKKALKRGYEVESFSITFKGVKKLPEISVNFKKKR